MKDTPGMPGPGGSLGQCAYCGKPFISEILLGSTVKQFQINGCNQTLSAHKDCLVKIKATKSFLDLPEESPLRIAFEAAKEVA